MSCIKKCGGRYKKYRFPKEAQLRQKWFDALSLESTSSPNIFVCEKHFSPLMLPTSRLIKDAFPDIIDDNDMPQSKEELMIEVQRLKEELKRQEEDFSKEREAHRQSELLLRRQVVFLKRQLGEECEECEEDTERVEHKNRKMNKPKTLFSRVV